MYFRYKCLVRPADFQCNLHTDETQVAILFLYTSDFIVRFMLPFLVTSCVSPGAHHYAVSAYVGRDLCRLGSCKISPPSFVTKCHATDKLLLSCLFGFIILSGTFSCALFCAYLKFSRYLKHSDFILFNLLTKLMLWLC